MRKKIWVIVLAVVLVAAVGTTVAFAAEDDSTWFRFGRSTSSEDRYESFVEDGILTQDQADSILSGDACLDDFIDCDNDGLGLGYSGHGMRGAGYMGHDEIVADLVEEGLLTQYQADSILAGEAHIYDFVDRDDFEGFRGYGMRDEMVADLVDQGLLTQEQADSILAGDSHIDDYLGDEYCGTGEGMNAQAHGRGFNRNNG